jgi:tRNA (guanine9-N1)-methyltransferase
MRKIWKENIGIFKSLGRFNKPSSIFLSQFKGRNSPIRLPFHPLYCIAAITMSNTSSDGERPSKLRKLSQPEPAGIPIGTQAQPSTSAIDPSPTTESATTLTNTAKSTGEANSSVTANSTEDPAKPLSKNALKRLRKAEAWEAGREERALKRREKQKARKEARVSQIAAAKESGDKAALKQLRESGRRLRDQKKRKSNTVELDIPVALALDCSFDALMRDEEITSLSQQIQRCYATMRLANARPRLVINGFSGRLKSRFDGVMRGVYLNWKGVEFTDGTIQDAAVSTGLWMKEVSEKRKELPEHVVESIFDEQKPMAKLVYLSAESENVLDKLESGTCYVIGGLIDKNRHKGHCYNLATKAGIPTARLPIDEYVKLSTRKVLTTNHVVEILVKFLETGDWEKSFVEIIPTRKGLSRKSGESDGELDEEPDQELEEDEEKVTEAFQ